MVNFGIGLWVFSLVLSVLWMSPLPVIVVTGGILLLSEIFGSRHAKWD